MLAVDRHAPAAHGVEAELVERHGNAGIGALLQPQHGLVVVDLRTQAALIDAAEDRRRRRVALLGRAGQPFEPGFRVRGGTGAPIIGQRQPPLGVGVAPLGAVLQLGEGLELQQVVAVVAAAHRKRIERAGALGFDDAHVDPRHFAHGGVRRAAVDRKAAQHRPSERANQWPRGPAMVDLWPHDSRIAADAANL